jgi:hypothetical protein
MPLARIAPRVPILVCLCLSGVLAIGAPGGDVAGLYTIHRASVAIVLVLTCVATDRGLALEPGDFGQYIRGIRITDPLGANPPPGLYFENTSLNVPQASGQGQFGGFKVNAWLDTPLLIWSTGSNVLGASVVAQPFANSVYGSAAPPYGGVTLYPTIHNTWINPFALS